MGKPVRNQEITMPENIKTLLYDNKNMCNVAIFPTAERALYL